MKFIIMRDGARLEVTNDGVAQFRGVLAKEVLNPNRVVSRMPPASDLRFNPGSLYVVYTGLTVNRLSASRIAASGLDIRTTSAAFKDSGVRVERVDIDGVGPSGELLIYISTMREFSLNKNEALFESFAFGQDHPTVEVAAEPVASVGFVPPATREFAEPVRNKAASPEPAREQTAEQRRAKADAWLAADDTPAGTMQPGTPSRVITDQFSDSPDKGLTLASARPATP